MSRDMKTLPHPTRWRSNVFVFASAAVGIVLVALAPAGGPDRVWWLWAAAPFIAAAVICTFLANFSRCPRCGRVLTRARRETAFTCYRCCIEWQCRDRTN